MELFHHENVTVQGLVLAASLENLVLFAIVDAHGDGVKSQQRVLAEATCHGLTTVIACKPTAGKVTADQKAYPYCQHRNHRENLLVEIQIRRYDCRMGNNVSRNI